MSKVSMFLRRRWPAIALVVSLLLNGFLMGMVAADTLLPHRGAFSGSRFARFELRRLDDKLPKSAVDRIEAALEPLGPEIDARLTKLREIRGEIMRLASAPEPDRAAIDSRLTDLRVETTSMQEAIQRATYDALLALPADARHQLADAPGS